MSLNTIQQKNLYQSPLFSGCDMSRYTAIFRSFEPITLVKGESVCQLPLYGPSICFLLAGEIEHCGNTDTAFINYCAPHCFSIILPHSSEDAAFLPSIRVVSSVATLGFLPLDHLVPYIEDDPILLHNLLQLQSDSLYQMTLIASRFSAESPSMRLAMLLLQQSVSDKFDILLGVGNLARILDISRATLYRSLGELEKLHLIERGVKSIYITDRAGLLDFVIQHSNTKHTRLT